MMQHNVQFGLFDFNGDINAQLYTLCKLTKSEATYVANTIRNIDNSRHCKSLPM